MRLSIGCCRAGKAARDEIARVREELALTTADLAVACGVARERASATNPDGFVDAQIAQLQTVANAARAYLQLPLDIPAHNQALNRLRRALDALDGGS